jgi:hypothetical protein
MPSSKRRSPEKLVPGCQSGAKTPILRLPGTTNRLISRSRMGGRAVEGTGLENRQGATPRGFESHPIRQLIQKTSSIQAATRLVAIAELGADAREKPANHSPSGAIRRAVQAAGAVAGQRAIVPGPGPGRCRRRSNRAQGSSLGPRVWRWQEFSGGTAIPGRGWPELRRDHSAALRGEGASHCGLISAGSQRSTHPEKRAYRQVRSPRLGRAIDLRGVRQCGLPGC